MNSVIFVIPFQMKKQYYAKKKQQINPHNLKTQRVFLMMKRVYLVYWFVW